MEESIRNGDLTGVKRLVLQDLTVLEERYGYHQATPALLLAIEQGQEEIVEWLVEHGSAEETMQDESGGTALMAASAKNSVRVARLLLEKGALVDAQDDFGETALMRACRGACFEVAQLLIEYGASLDLQNRFGTSALSLACRCNHVDIVRLLVESGASLELKDKNNSTVLHAVSSSGLEQVAKLLLEHGACVNSQNKFGNTALINACLTENEQVACLLTEYMHGADFNIQGMQNQTALMLASEKSLYDLVRVLLKKGAAVDLQDKDGCTALMLASDVAVVRQLLKHDAHPNIRDHRGNTALIFASAQTNKAEIVRRLLKGGATVDELDNSGSSALIHACSNGNEEVVRLLLHHGAFVDLQNRVGDTALTCVCKTTFSDDAGMSDVDFELHTRSLCGVVRLLLEHGASVDVCDNSGSTPLFFACSSGKLEIVKLLLENGAQVNVQNNCGETVLMGACREGNVEIVQTLVRSGAVIDLQDINGKTALLHLVDSANVYFESLETRSRSDSASVSSPLLESYRHGLRFLVENNADLELVGNDGLDALETAKRANNHYFAKLLEFAMYSQVSRVLQLELQLSRRVVLAFFDRQIMTLDQCASLTKRDLEILLPNEVSTMEQREKVLKRFRKRNHRSSFLLKHLSRFTFTKQTMK